MPVDCKQIGLPALLNSQLAWAQPHCLHTYADSHTGSTKSNPQQLSLGGLPAPPQVPSDKWTPPLPAALPPQWHASSTVTQGPNTTLQDCINTHTALALLHSAARTLGASYDCCAATALTLDACCRTFQPLQPVHLLEQQLSARLPHESSPPQDNAGPTCLTTHQTS